MENTNIRNLLKETRDALFDEMHGIHNGDLMSGVERRNRKDALIACDDAYLAAPSESAMEMVQKIREAHEDGSGDFAIDDSEAAALIEGYGRRVPRAMLEEIYNAGIRSCFWEEEHPAIRSVCDSIAYNHGVKVEG